MRSLDTVDCNPLGCCLSGSEGAIAANGAVELEETEALPGQAPVRTEVDVEIEVDGALEVVDANVEDNDDVSDGNENDDEDDDDNRAVGRMTSGMTRETTELLFITVSNLSFLFLL